MDLKTRKYIKSLPKYWLGKEAAIDSIWSGGIGVTNMLADNIVKSSRTVTEADLGNQGYSTGLIGGVPYRTINPVNSSQIMDQVEAQGDANTLSSAVSGGVSGAALGMGAGAMLGSAAAAGGAAAGGALAGATAGSAIPILGTAAGAILGSTLGLGIGAIAKHKQKKAAEKAIKIKNNKDIAFNNENFYSAYTDALNLDYARNHHIMQGKEGIQPGEIDQYTKQTVLPHVVDTSHGLEYGPANAELKKNEVIISQDGSMHKIKRGSGRKDDVLGYLKNTDAVASNDIINPETGNTIAKDAPLYAAIGEIPHLLGVQYNEKQQKQDNNKLEMAKYGRLPKFIRGAEWFTNAIPSITGILAGYQQYKDAASQDIDTSTILPADTSSPLISELYGARINPYPIKKDMYDAYKVEENNITRSGGLSIGQKLLARLAQNSQFMKALANTSSQIQQKNIDYRVDATKANIANKQFRQNMQLNAAAQDRANTAAAHASRQQGMQMGIRNSIEALEQMFSNRFKRLQFDKMYNLYAQDVANNAAKNKANAAGSRNNSTKPLPYVNYINSVPGPYKDENVYTKYPEWPIPVIYDALSFKPFGQ